MSDRHTFLRGAYKKLTRGEREFVVVVLSMIVFATAFAVGLMWLGGSL